MAALVMSSLVMNEGTWGTMRCTTSSTRGILSLMSCERSSSGGIGGSIDSVQ